MTFLHALIAQSNIVLQINNIILIHTMRYTYNACYITNHEIGQNVTWSGATQFKLENHTTLYSYNSKNDKIYVKFFCNYLRKKEGVLPTSIINLF